MINNLFEKKKIKNKSKETEPLIDTKVGILSIANENSKILTNKNAASVPDAAGATAVDAIEALPRNSKNASFSSSSGPLSNKNSGVLTLEFAFVLPALVALLYLTVNHYRFYDLKSRIKSSAYLAASMIQNLTNTRADKRLTKADLKRIAFASSLNIFVNDSVFTGTRGINYKLTIKYGKKTSGGAEGITITCNTTNKVNPNSIAYSGTSSSANDSGVTLSADGDEAMTIVAELIPASSGTSYNTSKMGFKNMNFSTISASFTMKITGNFKYQVQITPKPGIIDRTTLSGS